MKPSLYGQYIKERIGRGILETEDGFATFEYVTENIVYIVDLYVVPEKRKSRVASDLADIIVRAAVTDGKTQLLGSVDTLAKGSEDSVKVLEAYGMKPYTTQGTMIFYIKEIGVQNG